MLELYIFGKKVSYLLTHFIELNVKNWNHNVKYQKKKL